MYAGRGGSALADGARMISVLQTWTPESKLKLPPNVLAPEKGMGLTVLTRPKLSYSPPGTPRIWISRSGFKFEYHIERSETPEERDCRLAERAVARIKEELEVGQYHTRNSTTEGARKIFGPTGLTRDDFRRGIDMAKKSGFLREVEIPADILPENGGRHGVRT
ncbi:unnamed protein product, partial [marine sediment metagenome]